MTGDENTPDEPAPGEDSVPGSDVKQPSDSDAEGVPIEGEIVTDAEIAALLDQEQGAANAAAAEAGEQIVPAEISEEAVVALIAERDDYLDQLQRAKAEFANARRRSDERLQAQRAQAAASLVEKLLPVLDSCEAALNQGIEEVRPIKDALYEALAAQGLTRVDAAGEPFDPELHEAVMYEEGDGEQVVAETLRTGYRWNDRVLRAAMVKVKG